MKILEHINVSSKECVYIHRGRNKSLSRFFVPQTCGDYTYDFRGIKKIRFLSTPLGFLKSLIFALEVDQHKYYLLEGGMFIWIGIFLKIFNKNSKIIMNIADPTLAVYEYSIYSRMKRVVKLYLLSRFDIFITNSPMVKKELENLFPDRLVLQYYLPLFNDRLKHPIHRKRNFKKRVLMLITRPLETRRTKGLDIFLKIASHPLLHEYQFLLGGSGTELLDITKHERLTSFGHFHNVEEAFAKTDIIVVPSLYDAYPSVSIECFKYSVLPIISNGCVSYYDLKEVSNKLLVDSSVDIEEWIKKILEISSLPDESYYQILDRGIDMINLKYGLTDEY